MKACLKSSCAFAYEILNPQKPQAVTPESPSRPKPQQLKAEESDVEVHSTRRIHINNHIRIRCKIASLTALTICPGLYFGSCYIICSLVSTCSTFRAAAISSERKLRSTTALRRSPRERPPLLSWAEFTLLCLSLLRFLYVDLVGARFSLIVRRCWVFREVCCCS